MALIAERWGLIPELRTFAKGGHPIWGTCAGLIFLADRASGTRSHHWRAYAPIAENLQGRKFEESTCIYIWQHQALTDN